MAYIESFKIDGLASHSEPVARELDRHVNVFWGLNGTGKTSVLKILHAALFNEAKHLDRIPFTRAEVIFWSTSHDLRIKRTFLNSPLESEDEFDEGGVALEPAGEGIWREVPAKHEVAWVTELLSEGEPMRPLGRFKHSYLPISRLSDFGPNYRASNAIGASRRAVVDDRFLDEQFADQVKRRWQQYNSEALSSIRAIQQQGLAVILAQLFGGASGSRAPVIEQVDAAEAYVIVADFLRQQGIYLRAGETGFTLRYEEQTDLPQVVAHIQGVTREVEEALRPQQEFQGVIERLYSGGKKLILEPRRGLQGSIGVSLGDQTIALEALSSGEKQLLRLLLETLAAEEATVMIDEPELSLHVDWQQELVASMRKINPECQLLLATHSPEVMADVADEFVFEL